MEQKNIYLMFWMEMQLKLFSWNITVGKQYVFHRKLAVKWGANFVHQQEYHL